MHMATAKNKKHRQERYGKNDLVSHFGSKIKKNIYSRNIDEINIAGYEA